LARRRYVQAYSSPLKTGFDWYRAFPQDVEENRAARTPVSIPLLYVRGSKDSGNIERYLQSFREMGVTRVSGAVVADCGHFTPEEQPGGVWECIRAFVRA
jgi:pimeloyl-ACP methyl ester carboxylesterase